MRRLNRIVVTGLLIVGIFVVEPGSVVVAQATPPATAVVTDVGFLESGTRMVPEKFFAGDFVKFYVTLRNYGQNDVEGAVRFYVNGQKIGDNKPFSSRANGVDEELWFFWRATEGEEKLEFEIISDQESAGTQANNVLLRKISVDADTDRDGIGNLQDPDQDNDTLPNQWERDHGLNPLDASDALKDHDGEGLNAIAEFKIGTHPQKSDTDGDGFNDREDPAPLDSKKPATVVRQGLSLAPSSAGTSTGAPSPTAGAARSDNAAGNVSQTLQQPSSTPTTPPSSQTPTGSPSPASSRTGAKKPEERIGIESEDERGSRVAGFSASETQASRNVLQDGGNNDMIWVTPDATEDLPLLLAYPTQLPVDQSGRPSPEPQPSSSGRSGTLEIVRWIIRIGIGLIIVLLVVLLIGLWRVVHSRGE